MCLFIAEIVLFLAGIWALATGKVPGVVFGKKYRIEGIGARLIGLILILPIPVALIAGVAFTLILGETQGSVYGTVVEIVTLVLCLLVALLISYRIRKPAVIES